MARLGKPLLVGFVATAVLVAAGLMAYHAISPKIRVSNNSEHATSEVTFNLPDSRVTFSVLPPGSSATIYINKQYNDGLISYELWLNERRLAGSHAYRVDHQIGRTIQLDIDSSGEVKLSVDE